jgi:cob(I)alamin adenosyltransferase
MEMLEAKVKLYNSDIMNKLFRMIAVVAVSCRQKQENMEVMICDRLDRTVKCMNGNETKITEFILNKQLIIM